MLKYKLDPVSLYTGAGIAQFSSEVQQIFQDPSGHTQAHKTSISLQRDEHTPCESSLGLGMPKAATFNLLKL